MPRVWHLVMIGVCTRCNREFQPKRRRKPNGRLGSAIWPDRCPLPDCKSPYWDSQRKQTHGRWVRMCWDTRCGHPFERHNADVGCLDCDCTALKGMTAANTGLHDMAAYLKEQFPRVRLEKSKEQKEGTGGS